MLRQQPIRRVLHVPGDPSSSSECKDFIAKSHESTETALAILRPSVVPVYLSNFIECDSSSAARRGSARSSDGFRCKFFSFLLLLPPFALAFFPRHAHKRTQINTVPRPLSVSVDTSADSDSPPVPVSHLGTRTKKKKEKATETRLIWL